MRSIEDRPTYYPTPQMVYAEELLQNKYFFPASSLRPMDWGTAIFQEVEALRNKLLALLHFCPGLIRYTTIGFAFVGLHLARMNFPLLKM